MHKAQVRKGLASFNFLTPPSFSGAVSPLKNNVKVMIIYFNATFRRHSLVNGNTYKCWIGNTANGRPDWKECSPFSTVSNTITRWLFSLAPP